MKVRSRQNAVVCHIWWHDRRLARLQKHRRVHIDVALDHRQVFLLALHGAPEKHQSLNCTLTETCDAKV